VEAGESLHATIKREAMEEAGLILHFTRTVGEAIQIVYSAEEDACFEKRCVFIEAKIVGQVPSQECDHELVWVDLDHAFRLLSQESQRWALRTYTQQDASRYNEDD
jgi:8-oxo-dGTP pyrophosphatase MutT (NUDIX family)